MGGGPLTRCASPSSQHLHACLSTALRDHITHCLQILTTNLIGMQDFDQRTVQVPHEVYSKLSGGACFQ